ncbi:MAG: AmmeMemoRadiSam system protein A [Candidatus Woesearchaeota archaeon]
MEALQYSSEDKKELLNLAKESLRFYLAHGRMMDVPVWAEEKFSTKQGCFVTLHEKGMLRGCIGTIEPVYPLYEGIIKNAVAAAMQDPRFPPVKKEEFEELEFEVSILSVPEELQYSSSDELIQTLEKQKPGVIISRGVHSSTFLPQVWEQLPDPQEFLDNLCLKAGLSPDEWKNSTLKVNTYTAEVFNEKEMN